MAELRKLTPSVPLLLSVPPVLLREHLRLGASRPFVWGECDCCLWAADWVVAATGHDPAAAFRGHYADRRGAARALRAAGGLAAALASGLEPVARPGGPSPPAGTVGLVRAAAGLAGLAVVVRGLRSWHGKAERGLTSGEFDVLETWELACLR